MQRFAALYAALDAERGTEAKLAALTAYLGDATIAEEDRAWALWLLMGQRLKRLVAPTLLRRWIGEFCALPAALVEESYAQVGDLAETLALLAVAHREPPPATALPALSAVVAELQGLAGAGETVQRAALFHWWRHWPGPALFLLGKLLTGALRVGVSAGLAARALARLAALPTETLQHRLMGEWRPGAGVLSQLLAAERGARASPAQPYPFYLASPLEEGPDGLGDPADWQLEWKWDGIRGQLIRREGQTFLWSRGEELLNGRFPEIEAAAAALPDGTVLDGEILAWAGAGPLPFARLQTRIQRRAPGRRALAEAPVRFLAYDLLEHAGEDWRERPLQARRAQLEQLGWPHCSERLAVRDWAEAAALREQARARGVEGLMLKQHQSPYRAGRRRGAWWKWKLAPMTVDAVLVYAQAGHGRRSTLYTDYTLALWEGEQLVPVAKAYSGLTDEELAELDRWIRRHTLEKFGPVRRVAPAQVFEIAFEGLQASPRHKAGLALRFPRIARWRRDKPAAEADRLETLRQGLAGAVTAASAAVASPSAAGAGASGGSASSESSSALDSE
ncbi:MAG TPA: ATP-dependent DNA ligase [Nevskiaceae bacterium]|nr:ATP-dependent DNA ligase [Nevskiaceae bacterium]